MDADEAMQQTSERMITFSSSDNITPPKVIYHGGGFYNQSAEATDWETSKYQSSSSSTSMYHSCCFVSSNHFRQKHKPRLNELGYKSCIPGQRVVGGRIFQEVVFLMFLKAASAVLFGFLDKYKPDTFSAVLFHMISDT
ncbi:hypothetical protein LOAG_05618 [Loa loa]|uniref:Uncharacterized protein n=1 Tax=Loa loa TaxID=7209 RepID=A0A1S0TZF2_LOALO|nr:hypothetical protein LOAG_05618 [Loa loa]EFO22868.1 hypothetical protein LOAG_05618 [Loa loa]